MSAPNDKVAATLAARAALLGAELVAMPDGTFLAAMDGPPELLTCVAAVEAWLARLEGADA
jgi:hypothetical protein